MSGKDNNDEQPEKIEFILVALEVLKIEISGKDNNFEHPSNILLISVIFLTPLNTIFKLSVFSLGSNFSTKSYF